MSDDATHYWTRMRFKRSKVWVRADEEGEPIVEKGKLTLRYSRKPGPIYTAAARNVRPLDKAEPLLELPASADQAPPPKSNAKKAKQAADVAPPREGAIVIHTDGACTGNPGPAGLGVVLQWRDVTKTRSEFLGRATNNIAELTAILRGLEAIRIPRMPIDIYTDSTYAIGILSKGWKARENKELVAEIRALLPKFPDLRFHWVPGHAGVEGNERADALAREAIETRETRETDSRRDGPAASERA